MNAWPSSTPAASPTRRLRCSTASTLARRTSRRCSPTLGFPTRCAAERSSRARPPAPSSDGCGARQRWTLGTPSGRPRPWRGCWTSSPTGSARRRRPARRISLDCFGWPSSSTARPRSSRPISRRASAPRARAGASTSSPTTGPRVSSGTPCSCRCSSRVSSPRARLAAPRRWTRSAGCSTSASRGPGAGST